MLCLLLLPDSQKGTHTHIFTGSDAIQLCLAYAWVFETNLESTQRDVGVWGFCFDFFIWPYLQPGQPCPPDALKLEPTNSASPPWSVMSFSRLWSLDPASVSIQCCWDPFTGLINQDCLAVWYRSGPRRKTRSVPEASPHRPEAPFPPPVLPRALCAFLLPTHGPPLWSQGHWCVEPLDVGLRGGGGGGWSAFVGRLDLRSLLYWLFWKSSSPLTWPSGYIIHQRSSVSTHGTF